MKITEKGLNLLKQLEGFKSKPYLCQAGKATIGFGTTFYENGKPVSITDSEITIAKATDLLKNTLKKYEAIVSSLLSKTLNEQQFDALVLLSYNIGLGAFSNSTLLKKVNANPNDPLIKEEFLKWINISGKPSTGLTNRRKKEIDLYFS